MKYYYSLENGGHRVMANDVNGLYTIGVCPTEEVAKALAEALNSARQILPPHYADPLPVVSGVVETITVRTHNLRRELENKGEMGFISVDAVMSVLEKRTVASVTREPKEVGRE